VSAEQTQRPTIRVTLVRSTIGRPKSQESTVRSLGLRKLNSSVELPDTDSVRGMIAKVRHLVDVQETAE
jgi:large subunit ribosomal protein L30